MQLHGDLTHPTNASSDAADGDGGNRQAGGTWHHPVCQQAAFTWDHGV